MKKYLSALVCLSLICPAIVSADPMSQAQQMVDASQEQAQAVASEAVTGDFNFAMSEVLQSLVMQSGMKPLVQSLVAKQSKLLDDLNSISNLNPENVAKFQRDALAAYAKYKAIVRARFDLSFQEAEARESYRNTLRAAEMIMEQFVSNCQTGRGVSGLGGSAFRYPDLPKPNFGIQVGFTNGSPSNFNAHYDGTGSGAEKSRETINNITSSTAGYIASIAYTGTGSTAAMCAAAAPFAIGGAVAVAVVVAYLNAQERIKMQNEIVDAKVYAFHHTATDKDVGRYYREQCSDMSSQLAPIINVFKTAIRSPDQLDSMVTNQAVGVDLAKLHQKMVERDNLRKQIAELKKQHASQDKLEALATKVIAIENQVAAMTTPQRVSRLALQVLLSRHNQMASQFTGDMLQKFDLAQRRAFHKILQILEIVQRHNFEKFYSGKDEISKELTSLSEFNHARDLLKAVVIAQIRQIFGRETKANVQISEKQLAQATRKLMESYGYNHDVTDFAQQVHDLIGDI